ncbi:MAG TPA: effector-associated domain EAD1-containing protein, partial [Chthonomonadaceae bacterium]|nr:effector-associated domain EAD1-containing protein [Chthonomonadaceae bacterium]
MESTQSTIELSGEQFRQLQQALESAFPHVNDLGMMVRKGLSEKLDSLVDAKAPLKQIAFDLITWAEAQGRVRVLVETAYHENPDNPALKRFAITFLGLSNRAIVRQMPHNNLIETSEDAIAIVKDQLSQIVEGQFTIGAVLGTGAKSIVFRAQDLVLEREVAIKVLDPYKARQDEEVHKRFLASMKSVADLKHRHIIAVYAGKQDVPLPYIVMEYVNGVRLDIVIRKTGAQPIRKVRDSMIFLAYALCYAHQKGYFLHNLRPAGILMDKEGWPVISPFRITGESDWSEAQSGMINLEAIKYLSPEQYQFAGIATEITEASDQYTLGLIAYEMLLGRPVIAGKSFGEIRNEKEAFMTSTPDIARERTDCPPDLADMILRMLRVQSTDRWPDLEDICKRLQGLDLDAHLDPNSLEVRRSFERCRKSNRFFEAFYENFFRRHPEAKGLFQGDLEQQYYLLRVALDLVLEFSAEAATEHKSMRKVADAHRHIEASLYDGFTEALLETIRAFDPKCRDEQHARPIIDAWQATL